MRASRQSAADFEFDLAVVGLGYVGLPLVTASSSSGLAVLGMDIDKAIVDELNSGHSHIADVSGAQVRAALTSGAHFVSDNELLGSSRAIAICVPTPLTDGLPDLTAVRAAGSAIADHLCPGQLVVLESTTFPGTTEEVLLPALEAGSGLSAGSDFFVAFGPERVDPGNEEWGIGNTPKLVAGIDAESSARAVELYERFTTVVVEVSGTREAELAKLLENTYRHVNIALVNELAIYCREMGIDIWEVIRAAATKPYGFQAFLPGPGVGGHCIPVDPNYLSYGIRQLGYQFRLVELAQEINDRMPRYVVERASQVLNERSMPLRGSRVVLLGVTYKPDVSDTREAPAETVIRLLRAAGSNVAYVDPLVDGFVVDDLLVEVEVDAVEAASKADLVIIITPHRVFDLDAIVEAAPSVLDTRGVIRNPWVESI